ARVTRGALYHHFRGKEDLFRAVVEDVERELTERIAAEALAIEAVDPWAALRGGARAFLAASAEPEVQRIIMLDAPAVLGWEAWREIGERYGLGLVEGVLEAAMEAGALARQPARPLAHVLMGALDEAAMYVARADDVAGAREEMAGTIDRLLEGLRAGGD
ncbi:MAG: TetR/AcrR family transcriptional regulator, partial [Solirubrobacteraceae bacterium]